MQPLAFLPAVSESVMDELRTTEGMLFRDEGAKKLFLDVKSLVMESLGSAQSTFVGELYETVLDRYVAWDAAVASEELQRADAHFRDIAQRLTPVTVLYAKYLYAGGAPLRIRKPRVDALLRGMFTRLARLRHVRTGTFFELSPLQQDFVLRDMFRQTLATDCISIVVPPAVTAEAHEEADDADTAIVTPAPAHVDTPAHAPTAPIAANASASSENGVADASAAPAAAMPADDTDGVGAGAAGAGGSVVGGSGAAPRLSGVAPPRAASVVGGPSRSAASVAPGPASVVGPSRAASVAPPSTIVHTKPDDAATQAFVRALQEDDVYPDDSISRVLDRGAPVAAGGAAAPERQRGASVASHASVRSRVSQFQMPKDVRRVLIADTASETRTHVDQ